jgi:predicted glycoside hydrolase/deacetylase ChbG (UPF0249 family)
MSILINGDDFGKNEEINRAMCEAFEEGYIGHTTVMVNMPGAEEAYKLSKENGFTDRVGLHLNLTEGVPLSGDIRTNPLVCSSDGVFNAAFYHNTKYRLYMDSLSISQIEKELEAQIERFLELGFTELHIDSHHHVHTNYPVFLALKSLGKKYRFSYIRLSRNLYRGGSIFNRAYKTLYNGGVKKLCARSGDLFGSYDDLMSYTMKDPERIESLGRKSEVEIMVHPMYVNCVLTDTDRSMSDYGALKKWNHADK